MRSLPSVEMTMMGVEMTIGKVEMTMMVVVMTENVISNVGRNLMRSVKLTMVQYEREVVNGTASQLP